MAIGGVDASNVQRVMYQTKTSTKALDGVAIISAIIAAENPKKAASELRSLICTPLQSTIPETSRGTRKYRSVQELLERVPEVVRKVGRMVPLTHNMTNLVVQNFAANVALAM